MFKYPNVCAKTGSVPGAEKKNIRAAQKKGPPKCKSPYGIQASTSKSTNLLAERILLMLAP